MEADEGLIAELQRKATGADVHRALQLANAYRAFVKLSKSGKTEERRAQAAERARKVEGEIREFLGAGTGTETTTS